MKAFLGRAKVRRGAILVTAAVAAAALAGVVLSGAAAARGPGPPGGSGAKAQGAQSCGCGFVAASGKARQCDPAKVAASTARAESLSPKEQQALAFMREEELVAHDLYAVFSRQHPTVRAFGQIASSETRHASVVAKLLARYDLADPAAGHAAGRFSDQSLQAFYDTMLEQGRSSLGKAADVGVLVEKRDVTDLGQRLETVKAGDVQSVFEALRCASQNHLGAFTKLAARF